MPRFLRSVTLAACVLAAVAVAAQEQPIFRGTAELVRVFVTVTDGERLVTDLAQQDFEVRDEGKPQPIVLFDNSPQPIRLIVMLDVSGSMHGNLPLLRVATEQLFSRLRPDDRVRIGTFGHEVSISPTIKDVNDLRRSLPQMIAQDAPTPLWRGSDDAITALTEEDGGRRVILVLSDGKDSGPISFRQRFVSQVQVIERAREQDVMMYGVGMRSRSAQPMAPGMGPGGLSAALTADWPDPGLARVAQETGGGFTEIRYGQDLGAAFAQVADELHSQYLIGYAPPKRDGKVHEVEVRVSKRGLKPRARKSYVAPKG